MSRSRSTPRLKVWTPRKVGARRHGGACAGCLVAGDGFKDEPPTKKALNGFGSCMRCGVIEKNGHLVIKGKYKEHRVKRL